ncbi:MAG: energy transducer TonB [Paludibacteraceae bacterium]|nr:energy transducer TonB [Paludibacteraceae bacterium]
MNRYISLIVGLLFGIAVMAQDKYLQYENLYPNCVDNMPSKIYSPNKKPKELNMPEFPGGGAVELTRYVFHNIEYPEVIDSVATDSVTHEDITYLVRGTVLCRITVDRCGRAQNPQIIQSVAPEYDAEALRIMEGLPVFKPGDLNGEERVKVDLIIPVHFNRIHPKPVVDDGYYDYQDYGSYDSYDSYDSYSY